MSDKPVIDHCVWKLPPEPKGYYVLGTAPGAFQIALYYKPNFIHRFFMKVCLGFVWRDNG